MNMLAKSLNGIIFETRQKSFYMSSNYSGGSYPYSGSLAQGGNLSVEETQATSKHVFFV